MSQTYKIYRWDAVLFKNDIDPTPIIYVKPEKELLEFVEKNNNTLLVKLHSPGSIYNNKKVVGRWYKSSEIPNCHINFFEETGLYVIALYAPWHGYPDCLGECSVYGVKGGVKATEVNIPSDPPVDQSISNRKISLRTPAEPTLGNVINSRLPTSAIIGIIAGILVLIGILIIIFK
jgi:hypothetical protein